MIKSITHFAEESINIFEELEDEFFKHPEKMAEYVIGITKELHKIGLLMIQESLEEMNQQLKVSRKRRNGWIVEKDTLKQLITSLGTVHFTKTLFTNKETGEMEYLLDRVLGLEKHERISKNGSKYTYGKNDLFSVVITFRYLLPKTDFLLFKKQLLHIFDRYEKQNSNLKLNDLFEYMGFPSNWKEITKFRKI